MQRKISITVAVMIIVISVILPFILKSDNSSFFSWKIVIAMALTSMIVGALYIVLLIISKHQQKGSIFIAYLFNEVEFVHKLKEKLRMSGYKCYPDLSSLINGSKIKDLNLESQIEKSELLIVFLSDGSQDSQYISYITRIFKKQGKPIQVYAFDETVNVPDYLKPYMIFPLPEDKSEAISMVVSLVNGLFFGNQLRRKKII